MVQTPPSRAPQSTQGAVGAAYDAVAQAYDFKFRDELDGKPLDRRLLEALLDFVGAGTVVDLGCGPGHVTGFLAAQHAPVIGIDLSPGMISVAHERSPELAFAVGSMLSLPTADSSCAGALALYSIIHLTPEQRLVAYGEFARTLRHGGWLLVGFHIDSAEFAMGDVNHVTTWFGQPVDLAGFFLDPAAVVADLQSAGFAVMAKLERQPLPDIEYPSRRCYVLAQRL